MNVSTPFFHSNGISKIVNESLLYTPTSLSDISFTLTLGLSLSSKSFPLNTIADSSSSSERANP
jgi:hypothetical protein